jgi:hypothetical protein
MSAPMTPALDEIRSENTGPFTGIIQNVDGTAK